MEIIYYILCTNSIYSIILFILRYGIVQRRYDNTRYILILNKLSHEIMMYYLYRKLLEYLNVAWFIIDNWNTLREQWHLLNDWFGRLVFVVVSEVCKERIEFNKMRTLGSEFIVWIWMNLPRTAIASTATTTSSTTAASSSRIAGSVTIRICEWSDQWLDTVEFVSRI